MSGRINQIWINNDLSKKACNSCKAVKDLIEFPKTKSKHLDGTQGICKKCKAKWMQQDRKRNPDRYRNHDYKKYGIDLNFYNYLAEKQNYLCAICGKPETKKNKFLHVDHCHTSNKVRGLLCESCNLGVGLFLDNTKILSNAINYLNANGGHTGECNSKNA